MKLNQVTLGKLSIGFALCGLVIPFMLGFIAGALGQPGVTLSVGLLFLCLELTAIASAIAAHRTREAGIGFGIAAGSLFMILIAAVFLANHRAQDPKSQALAYYRAMHDQNWRVIWKLTAFTPMERRVWRSPEAYERDMLQNLQDPGARKGYDYFAQLRDISVGTPYINGNRASVPTSATLPYNGRVLHLHGIAHLRNDDGTWKVIVCESDSDDPARGICGLMGIPYYPQRR